MKNPPDHDDSAPPISDVERERQKRLTVESTLRESTQRYERLINTVPCALYDYVLWPDGRSRFFYISPQCAEIFDYTAEQIMADAALLWSTVHPDDVARLQDDDRLAYQSGDSFQSEVRITLPTGGMKWIQLTSRPGPQHVDGRTMWSGVIRDITARKRAEEERNQLVAELQTALAKIKTLSGLLPICASCKKIRDDRGYWNQLESYICNHTDAEFTHGMCPECAEKALAEFKASIATKNPFAP